jgi:uncharacterized protein (TIGR03067 family)
MPLRLLSLLLCALLATALCTRADDLKAMEGTWTVEAVEAGGQPVDSDDIKAIVVKITGDHYEAKLKDGSEAGTLKLDETQKPKTMDATKTEGFEAGKMIKAVYEISGDTMRVCYNFEGEDRPTELATRDGSKWVLVTYKREK